MFKINGLTVSGDLVGGIRTKNGRVYVNNQDVTDQLDLIKGPVFHLHIHGEVGSIEAEGDVTVNGNTHGITATGDVTIQGNTGDVRATGDVSASQIHGDVTATGGDVTATTIGGKVSAVGGDINYR